MSGKASPTLQVENIRVASVLIALAVKRGAFEVNEVDEVSACYKTLTGFLSQYQSAQSAKEPSKDPAQPSDGANGADGPSG